MKVNKSAFERKRNIEGISLLMKRVELEIRNGSSTTDNEKESFPLKIRCCGGCGFSTSLNVEPSDLIADVKFKMWLDQGIPPHQQRLIHGELQLDDNRTLNDYNIKREHNLRMVLHLRGYNSNFEEHFDQISQVNFLK